MAAVSTPVGTCKNGHAQTDANVVWVHDKGKRRARCGACRRDAMQRLRERKAALTAGVATTGRRTRAINGKVDESNQTRTIFSLLPTDLRTRLAGVLMAPPPTATPVQIAVLRTASQRRIWYRADGDAVTRMYVEAVLDATIDARSPSARVDRVLALLLGD